MRFLHCSDVHITQDYSSAPFFKLGWRRWTALLELSIGGRAKAYRDANRTLQWIAGAVERGEADHLVLSGDLTGYAAEQEFAVARESLGKLADSRSSFSVIPGNHDCFTPNSIKTKRFERYFGHVVETDMPEYCRDGAYPFVHLKGDEAAVIGLHSSRVPIVPGLAYGSVGSAQISGLRDIVGDRRLDGRAVLVMVHHAPLRANGRKDSRIHGLLDADALLNLLPGPRFAVLHGHIHQRYYHAPTATRPHVFCAGSSTELGREGYWLIDVKDGVITGGSAHTPLQSFAR
ncbi:MAG TPA: metallophosphoesterase [Gemmatimonadaceae bacterium]|nr:metallophosphoesterase [Gemmatimonadaceae bacterium]